MTPDYDAQDAQMAAGNFDLPDWALYASGTMVAAACLYQAWRWWRMAPVERAPAQAASDDEGVGPW